MKDYQKLVISIMIPLTIGLLGSFFTASSVGAWYMALNKPSFNPPNWVFGPVWTVLYILMGISFYMVWEKLDKIIIIYSIQLFLNLLWSLLFFGLRNPLLALIEIVILWFAILVNVLVFYRIKKFAGILLIPYLLWVSFATLLNYELYILN